MARPVSIQLPSPVAGTLLLELVNAATAVALSLIMPTVPVEYTL